MPERSRTFTVAGIVLRQRSLGEKDRIVVVYSRERGKLSAVAKGARQPRSKLAAMTQPMTYSRFTIAAGRSLGILTQGVVEEPFLLLKQDLLRMALATCAIELIEKAVPEGDPAEEVFNLLLGSLYALQTIEEPEVALRAFELQLLHLLGYLPTLKRCARCNAPLKGLPTQGAAEQRQVASPQDCYVFSPQFGGTLCHPCRAFGQGGSLVSAGAIQTMVALRSGDPIALRRLKPTPQTAREIRRALSDFIQYRLEIDLKSRHFVEQVQALAADHRPIP